MFQSYGYTLNMPLGISKAVFTLSRDFKFLSIAVMPIS